MARRGRNATHRSAIIPNLPVNATNTAEVHRNTAHHSAPARISSALKRVFDIEHCPHCGGPLKIIAAIENPAVIAKILAHLGLAARPPPRAPVQTFHPQGAQQDHSLALLSLSSARPDPKRTPYPVQLPEPTALPLALARISHR